MQMSSASDPAATPAGTPLASVHSDADAIVDRLDLDSDDDGITDCREADGPDPGLDCDGYLYTSRASVTAELTLTPSPFVVGGIDVEQVSHVVNFDMPTTADAYTHRIGRTGRADRQGKAYTFVTAEDHNLVAQVERRLRMSIERRQVHGI